MGSLVDTLFGGKDDSAQKAQIDANREAVQLIERNTKQARGDAFNLFGQASDTRRAGYESALDLLKGLPTRQFNIVNQGRQNMQDTFLEGHNQVQNALMGLPTDLSGLRKDPISMNYTAFLQGAQLPERSEPYQPGLPQVPYPYLPPEVQDRIRRGGAANFLGGI